MVGKTILDEIGNTPLIKLRAMTSYNVLVKAEFLNPGGSIKDRVAQYLIEEAEKEGKLTNDSIIMEPSSGNTGIGMVFVGVQKGYRVIIVMPEDMSEERKKIIKAFGGELILTPAKNSLEGCVEKVEELAKKDHHIYVPQQFENPRNPEIHYLSTGPEIWSQTEGLIDAFVAGVGSGGTLGGVGKFLKEKNHHIKVIAVEPKNSAALLGHEPGLHQIQGIGDGFVPKVLDVSLIDEVITVSDEDAINTARELAKKEGLLVGTSSGANVWSSIKAAEKLGTDKNVITVLPDRAERYFSTSLI
ncbi:MAG: cysteine synthase [Deltaproteobacteria bacterium DG_8]|nr:MAG: cysteine synthase [Deltaproteobacteria bacterium DG_8]